MGSPCLERLHEDFQADAEMLEISAYLLPPQVERQIPRIGCSLQQIVRTRIEICRMCKQFGGRLCRLTVGRRYGCSGRDHRLEQLVHEVDVRQLSIRVLTGELDVGNVGPPTEQR